MADTEKIVDPDNGPGTDYTGIAAWDTAWGGVAGNGDCVGNTTRAVADCRCTGGTADGDLQLYIWAATDADYYCYIKADSTYQWDKTFPTSGNIYRAVLDGATRVWDIRVDYTRVEGVALRNQVNGSHEIVLGVDTCTEVLIDRCCMETKSGGVGNARGLLFEDIDSGACYARNCLAYDTDDTFAVLYDCESCAGGDIILHHCTATIGGTGFKEAANAGSTFTCNNCVCVGATTQWDGTWAGDYNGSDGGTPPGANDVTVATTDFADFAAKDYTLSGTGSAMYQAGPTLYSDATLPVTEDWEEDARASTGSVSIGFDDIAVATAAVPSSEVERLGERWSPYGRYLVSTLQQQLYGPRGYHP
jgi:hypothetical protein